MFDVESLVREIVLHVPPSARKLYKPRSTDELRRERERPEESEGSQEASDDFLACYRSYFEFGPDWGIYFDLARMAAFVRQFSFGDDPALVKKVLHHERFHFLVEYFGALLEDTTQNLAGNYVYESYHRQNPPAPYHVHEEAMANAYALTRSYGKKTSPAPYTDVKPTEAQIVHELKAVCDQAPKGYRDYPRVMDPTVLFNWNGTRRNEQECFNNSVLIFFDAMRRHQGITFQQFQNPLGGTLLHSQMLLLSPNKLQKVPMYVCYPLNYWAGSKKHIYFHTPNARLAKFYRFLEVKYDVLYRDGKSHAKLQLPNGRKLNGWSRRRSKADVRRYQIAQAADWLNIPAKKIADEFANWL